MTFRPLTLADLNMMYVGESTPHYDIRVVCQVCGLHAFTESNWYTTREVAERMAESIKREHGSDVTYVVAGCAMRTMAEHDVQARKDWRHCEGCRSKA